MRLGALGLAIMMASAAYCGMSSTDYEIPVSVLDGGGAVASSTNHSLLTATGQAGEIGVGTSTNYTGNYGVISQQYEALPPSRPEVEIAPAAPTTTDDLICTVVVPTHVSPGLAPQYEYSWSNGINTVVHGPNIATTDTLSSVFTLKHQTWTCSVRGYDGRSYSPLPGTATVTTINTPPGPLSFTIPAIESTGVNLRCYFIKSADPDSDVVYSTQWFVQHLGAPSPVLWTGDVIITDALTQIDASDTGSGDVWTCKVTYGDGEETPITATSSACRIVSGGITTSYLYLSTSNVVTTLGESMTLSGQVLPVPADPDRRIRFFSTPPEGALVEFPEDVGYAVSTGTFNRTFFPTQASEGRADWQVYSYWSGDSIYSEATSSTVSYEVLKAQPGVSVSLSHTSALLNLGNAEDFAVSVAFSVANWPSDPALQALLAGRTIRLSVMTPEGTTPWAPLEQVTDTDGVARFTAAGFASAGILFDTAGTWKFKAEFPGDDNFRLAASEDFNSTQAKLTIKEGAGYAVMVLGRLDAAAEGHAEHAQTTDYAYSILRERGFTDDDIFYMREFLPGDIPNTIPVDGPPNAATLQYAIETWATAKMTASPAPLYLVMVDHGNTGLFRLDDGSTGPQEYVTAEEIAGWLDVLESSTDQPVFCIYGACYSGSFIPVLSAPNRVVITSTAPGEISYRGVVNSDTGLRDGDFFLTEFFRNAGEGRTIRNAFELACFKTYEYTASRSGDASSIPQHPMLDDNADGVGTTGLLSSSPGFDGAFVSGQDLGLGSNAGNGVTWFSVAPPITIETGVTVELWAETTGRPLLPGDQAWLEIKTPAYDDGEVATPGYDEFQRVAEMAGPIAPSATEDLGGGKYRFRWTEADLLAHPDFADGFDTQGTYKAYYFLRDAETGQVGTYLVTNIYKPKPDNDPPTTVTLLYPKNNAIVNPSLFLAWDESTDPNNDAFTYRVEVSESDTFPEGGTIVRDGLTDTTLRLGTVDGIQNDHDYYWRVTAVDKWGAESAPNTVWLFQVRGNPGVLGAIRGKVTVKDMTLPVVGAIITVIPTSKQGTTSGSGSYFVGDLEQGVYNVNVTADGYKSQAVTGVFVESGDYTTLNVSLEPELINHAPVLTTFGNQAVWIGETFTGQLTATDVDPGTVLTFTSPDLPTGSTLNPTSGVFAWSPTNADTGAHTITFTATDNGLPPLADTKTVVVTVKGGAAIAGPSTVEVGQPFQLMFYVPQKDANWVYEWRKDGTLLPAETGNILLRPSAVLSDSGWYEATGWDQSEIPIRPLTARHPLTVAEDLPASGCAALILLFTTLAATYIAVHGRRR